MIRIFLFLCFLIFPLPLFAQLAYTQNQFGVRVENDIEYGISINYAGLPDTLKLDLYKPAGDNNCQRPILVIIHGGSWIAGTKKDNDVVGVAMQMAAKGYVVASINYRLGTHKAASWTQWLFCSTDLVSPCLYIADSSEIFRAIYRGMQDAKGAIRFMKNRSVTDSTDAHNTFVAGASAGAFIAMAVAFLDLPLEKPANCSAISNAPEPAAGVAGCNPSGTSFLRPDLGNIDGDLNTGGVDATVRGVGDFYGGLSSLRWMEGSDTPVIYIFHQQSDVIVNSVRYPLLGRINNECINGICQPTYFYPWMYGGKSIADSLLAMGSAAPAYRADIIYNYNGNANCLQNPPGHAIDNIPLRSQNMADLFAPVIVAGGNVPSSNCITGLKEEKTIHSLSVFPNPVTNHSLMIQMKGWKKQKIYFSVYDLMGRAVLMKNEFSHGEIISIQLSENLQGGIYILSLQNESGEIERTLFEIIK